MVEFYALSRSTTGYASALCVVFFLPRILFGPFVPNGGGNYHVFGEVLLSRHRIKIQEPTSLLSDIHQQTLYLQRHKAAFASVQSSEGIYGEAFVSSKHVLKRNDSALLLTASAANSAPTDESPENVAIKGVISIFEDQHDSLWRKSLLDDNFVPAV